jgi:hypothetical protein
MCPRSHWSSIARRSARRRSLHILVVLAGSVSPVTAADLGSVQGFDIRLDTSVRTSLGLRTEGQSAALLGDANTDDGDRSFKAGVISERIDFISQLDIARGDLGFDLSANGWYDAAYHRPDSNRSSTTFNPISVKVDEFPSDVRRLMGASAELGNAYVHDKVEVVGIPVTIRVGRQTLLWGESLFFPQVGISAAQAPVDTIKQLSQPLVENREVFLPVNQADIRVLLPFDTSIEAYEQFEWRRDRTPGVASYFSTSDVLDVGGERAFTPGGGSLFRAQDDTPSSIGQFGVALRRSTDALNLGLYAIRYNAKEPQLSTADLAPTAYRLVFPRGIDLLGVSASTYVQDSTLAGEISERWHMPLVSRGLPPVPIGSLLGSTTQQPNAPLPAGPVQADYATGETLQALVSFEAPLRRGPQWDNAVLDAEFAVTDLLHVETLASNRLAGTTRLATAFEAVFTPQYFQVLPNLDVAVPIGVQVGLSGRSSVDPGLVAGTGNVTLSVSAKYKTVWEGGISYTHFIGPPGEQPLADRDFVAVTLGRTF